MCWVIIVLSTLGTLVVDSHRQSRHHEILAGRDIALSGTLSLMGGQWMIACTRTGARYRLLLPSDLATPRLNNGDIMVVRGRLADVVAPTNPGAFDTQAWMKSRGVAGSVRPARLKLIHHHPTAPTSLGSLRSWFRTRIDRSFRGEKRALMLAMMLGERSELTRERSTGFRKAGLSHLLAISGLHFGIVVGMIWMVVGLITSRLSLPWAGQRVLLILMVAAGAMIYASMVGWSPSVKRAFIMLTIGLVGLLSNRRGWLMRSLTIAALFISAFDVHLWRSVGTQLSFSAVGGIAIALRWCRLLYPEDHTSMGMLYRLVSTMLVSAGAFLGTTPVLLFHMGWVPFSGLLASPPAIVLASVALASGAVAIVTPVGAGAVAAFSGSVVDGLFWLTEWTLAMDLPVLSASSPRDIALPIALFALLSIISVHGVRRYWRLVMLVLAATIIIAMSSKTYSIHVTMLDVGQGEALMFAAPGEDTIVIDTGPGPRAGRTLSHALQHAGRFTAQVMLTHGDSDHTGGLNELSTMINVTTVMGPWRGKDHDVKHRRLLGAGDQLDLPSSLRAYVLHPFAEGDDNAHSLVLMIVYGDQAILLTGDIEAEEEQRLLAAYGPMFDAKEHLILKVPHHGSATSSTSSFLDGIKPDIALASVGASNRFGHPDELVVERFAQKGVPLLTTVEQGAMRVRLRPDGASISSFHDGRWRRVHARARPHQSRAN